jgi:type IV pilus assembly protein PilB
MAIHEVMAVSKQIEHLANTRGATRQIAEAAREEGMVTLREDGWAKVKAGHTSVAELLRVVA